MSDSPHQVPSECSSRAHTAAPHAPATLARPYLGRSFNKLNHLYLYKYTMEKAADNRKKLRAPVNLARGMPEETGG